ncbi:MAG: penicillin acylase family protein, partial [Pseudomonadales bacterium]|nr:penicillin acylase family protein [Pseudomonadales bacterium]
MKNVRALILSFVLMPVALMADETTSETLAVKGLHDSVEIAKDQWGISHIYAKNQHDLFFAQGWNAARDRLFQFEMWR